jgi:hypothetical protein
MLTPSELSAVSALDAALATAASNAAAAADEAEGDVITYISSSAAAMAKSARANADEQALWLGEWRKTRDALLESPDHDAVAVAELVARGQRELGGASNVVALADAETHIVPNAVMKTVNDTAKRVAQLGKTVGDGLQHAADSFGWVAYAIPVAALGLGVMLAWHWLKPPRGAA